MRMYSTFVSDILRGVDCRMIDRLTIVVPFINFIKVTLSLSAKLFMLFAKPNQSKEIKKGKKANPSFHNPNKI